MGLLHPPIYLIIFLCVCSIRGLNMISSSNDSIVNDQCLHRDDENGISSNSSGNNSSSRKDSGGGKTNPSPHDASEGSHAMSQRPSFYQVGRGNVLDYFQSEDWHQTLPIQNTPSTTSNTNNNNNQQHNHHHDHHLVNSSSKSDYNSNEKSSGNAWVIPTGRERLHRSYSVSSNTREDDAMRRKLEEFQIRKKLGVSTAEPNPDKSVRNRENVPPKSNRESTHKRLNSFASRSRLTTSGNEVKNVETALVKQSKISSKRAKWNFVKAPLQSESAVSLPEMSAIDLTQYIHIDIHSELKQKYSDAIADLVEKEKITERNEKMVADRDCRIELLKEEKNALIAKNYRLENDITKLRSTKTSNDESKQLRQQVEKHKQNQAESVFQLNAVKLELGKRDREVDSLLQKIETISNELTNTLEIKKAFEEDLLAKEEKLKALTTLRDKSTNEAVYKVRDLEEALVKERKSTEALRSENVSLKEEVDRLRQKLVESSVLLENCEGELVNLKSLEESRANEKNNELSLIKKSLDDTKCELDDVLNKYQALKEKEQIIENEKCRIQLDMAKSVEEANVLRGERDDVLTRLNIREIESTQMEQTCNEKTLALSTLQKRVLEFDSMQELFLLQQTELKELRRRILDEDKVRQTLHNKVIELKGNIRVFCRVRPLLSHEKPPKEDEDKVFSYPEHDPDLRMLDLVASTRDHVSYRGQSNTKLWNFEFDRVFGQDATQEEMFVEVSALAQSAVDGYRVCIFAYGQTGSGKTYTMQGKIESPQELSEGSPSLGMVGRTFFFVFAALEEQKFHGWKYTVSLEMMEIYNEQFRDLLSTDQGAPVPELRLDSNKKPYVKDLTRLIVTSGQEALSILRSSMARRSTKKTLLNDQSSRSHCVISLQLQGQNLNSGRNRNGLIHMIDLAGSERLSYSGSGEDITMLKEAQSINKSLSSLQGVISSIVRKERHIPFRDSKLTHFLQPSLEGDNKALMICNLSPLPRNRSESLNTLRFASQVNSCEITLSSKK